jgi:hypothetical protein
MKIAIAMNKSAAAISVRADNPSDICFRYHFGLEIERTLPNLEVTRQSFIIGGLMGTDKPAHTRVLAFDFLIRDELLQITLGFSNSRVHCDRSLGPKCFDHVRERDSQRASYRSSIACTCAISQFPRF